MPARSHRRWFHFLAGSRLGIRTLRSGGGGLCRFGTARHESKTVSSSPSGGRLNSRACPSASHCVHSRPRSSTFQHARGCGHEPPQANSGQAIRVQQVWGFGHEPPEADGGQAIRVQQVFRGSGLRGSRVHGLTGCRPNRPQDPEQMSSLSPQSNLNIAYVAMFGTRPAISAEG